MCLNLKQYVLPLITKQNSSISRPNLKVNIRNDFDLELTKSWLKIFDIFIVMIKMKY